MTQKLFYHTNRWEEIEFRVRKGKEKNSFNDKQLFLRGRSNTI